MTTVDPERPSGSLSRIPAAATAVGDLGWLLFAGILLLTAGLGLRDPWPADEPRFALMAREMVRSGHWFFPTLGGELYADKPPLFIWLQAIFYYLTGSLRIAFLLPNLLAGLGSIVLVYDLARRLWDRRVAVAAGLLLLATIQFVLQARSGQIDGLVSFWICLAVYGLLRHMLLGPQWGWYWFGCFAAGLGVITKGVGLIALFMLLPYWLARRQHWQHLAAISGQLGKWCWGAACFLLAICLWAVPMLVLVELSADPAFAAYRDNILFHQTVERYSDAWIHLHPFWYYLVQVIPVMWLPLTVLLPWLAPKWVGAWIERDARVLLPLVWIGLVVLFFSLSPGKRGVYLTPAVPLLALASAPYLEAILGRVWTRRTLYGVTGLIVLVCAVLYLAHIFSPGLDQTILEKYQLRPWTLLLSIAVLGAGALILFPPQKGYLTYAAFFAGFWLCLGWIGYPQLNDARSSRLLMEMVNAQLPPGRELALVGWHEQTLLQAGRPVVVFGYRLPLEIQEARGAAWLSDGENRWLLVDGRHTTGCFDLDKAHFVVHLHRTDWYLVDAHSISSSCAVAHGPLGAVSYGA